jgi:putative hemolysin
LSRYWFDFGLIAVLMLLNALFAGSEIALISLREGQLRALERRGKRADLTLVRLARDPNRFLGTIQLGITLAGYLASATAAVTLAGPLVNALGFAGAGAEAIAIGTVTFLLAAVNLVFGELAPKRLAMQYPQRWASVAAVPLDLLATLTRPVVWVLGKATDVVVRAFGGDPEARREQLSPAELRDLVIGHPGLTPEQRTAITGALEIHQRTLREVLVPRTAVICLPEDLPTAEARVKLAQSGHSRAPVVRSAGLDDVIGVVHLRDLVESDRGLAEVAREPMLFPDSVRVTDALRRFRDEHEQFALVVDERGGVAGIVTLEDLLEEIVGEIYDETDIDIRSVASLSDGSVVVPGSFPVHDLVDLDVDIGPEAGRAVPGDYTTIAGLGLVALGRIPTRPGDRVSLPKWTVEVTGVNRNAITEVRLIPEVGKAREAQR